MKNRQQNDWVIFDMDGTLWNTLDVIVECWNYAFSQFPETRGKKITQEELMPNMGKTMDQFAAAILPELSLEQAVRVMQVCVEEENLRLSEKGAIIYDGVEEIFPTLVSGGYRIGIVSNCQSGYIDAFLTDYKLGSYVSDTLCWGDDPAGKASNIRTMIRRNHVDSAVYVGDTQGDCRACMQAGVPFIFAAYGFGEVEDDVPLIRSVMELPALLNHDCDFK